MRLAVFSPPHSAAAGFESGPASIAAVRVLRISITDRCNFRCLYCMPEEGVRWLPREQILSFEEIREVVRAAVELHGIRRFKLTGGEPTVRHGLVDLVAMLRRVDGIQDLSLTTNGMRLLDLAGPLREAGLDRVTVSIDSLRPDRFARITRTGHLATVLSGIDRCEQVGFGSIKINCVTMRGTNDDEMIDFSKLTLRRRLTVRFIEYMPLGDSAIQHGADGASHIDATETGPAGGCGAQDRGRNCLISENEVRERIERNLGPLIPVDRNSEPGVGPANTYRLAVGDPLGRIGFISAMSAPFCSTCNRLRLTANGVLRSCLFEGGEVDILPLLRESRANEAARKSKIARAMSECVRHKPQLHGMHGNEQMSRIGG